MSEQKEPKPLEILQDIDLDATLTETERFIVRDTPFFALAWWVGGVFALALIGMVLGNTYQTTRARGREIQALDERIASVDRQARTSSPQEVVRLSGLWRAHFRQVSTISVDEKTRTRLLNDLYRVGTLLLTRAHAHMGALEYLEMVEAARLAGAAHSVLGVMEENVGAQGPAPANVRDRIDQVVEAATREAVRLASGVSSATDLRRASSIIVELIPVVDPRLAQEFQSTLNTLQGRARIAEERGPLAAMAPDTGDGANERQAFAESVMGALQSAGLDMESVELAGEEGRVLALRGGIPTRRLIDMVAAPEGMPDRLLGLGFVAIEAYGLGPAERLDLVSLRIAPLR